MKILILYTARSGTNSISDYFLKQNPHYKYFNQPFTIYQESGIKRTSYDNCIKYNDVLIKSEISNFKKLNITKEKIKKDFDKVLLISRKDKTEQSISCLMAVESENFLDRTKKSYFIDGIDRNLLKATIEHQKKCENMLDDYLDDLFPFFYYEDLYYHSFEKLFEYLNIKYIDIDFENILNKKNRYKNNNLYNKNINTII
jgi:hypothetical protein